MSAAPQLPLASVLATLTREELRQVVRAALDRAIERGAANTPTGVADSYNAMQAHNKLAVLFNDHLHARAFYVRAGLPEA